MKLGDVMCKERTGNGLNRSRRYSVPEIARELGITEDEYSQLEAGASPAERWFPLLCELAVKLEVPTSRLVASSGASLDTRRGRVGALIWQHRENRGKTIEEVSSAVGLTLDEYRVIERGESPIETYGPLMLKFSELIDQPIFNLYLPCGVPYRCLDAYP